jgi:4-amino-4-deoxy-L-arabinose transferase-like glycosyltransferase
LLVTTVDMSRTDRTVLVAVLAVALGLRTWNLTAGLPYAVGVDEPQLVERAVRMMKTGDYHPHFFDYPSLYIYAQLLMAIGRFLAGAFLGEYRSLSAFTGENLYPVARLLTAIVGVATVWLTTRIGMRWGRTEALVGALLLAVMPMHVRESHYVLTDVPVTFFVTLTLLASLRAGEQPTLARFAQAGAAAGLAAATKYNGGLVVVLPLVVAVWPAIADRAHRVHFTGVVLGSALVAFLLTAPYTVLDLPAFLQEFARLNGEYRTLAPASSPWLIYLKHLRLGFGWLALVASVCGLGLALFHVGRATNGVHRLRWLLLALFPLLYYAMLSGRTLIFGRYLLPLLPMLCLMAGIALAAAATLARQGLGGRAAQALVVLLLLAVVVPPARTSVLFDTGLGAPSTRRMAYRWLLENVPADTKIAVEAGALRMPDGAYPTVQMARIIDQPLMFYRAHQVRYLITSSEALGADPEQVREYFNGLGPLFVVAPSEKRRGPEIRIYAVPAASP